MTDRQEVLKRMKKIEDYFQRMMYFSEFECAKAIREKAGDTESLTAKDAEDILKVYNETNEGRLSGSGWLDFHLHVRHLLTIDNFNVEVDNTTGRMKINAG